jgi:sialate O-acetylesterase
MAVTFDIMDTPDLHPKNKQEVGYRLARAAQAIAYGRDVPYSGPIYDSMSVEGEKIRVRFLHVEGGLVTKSRGGDPLMWFEIAGKDRKFVFAEAKIEGQTIVVSSPKVPNPVALRYGFSSISRCNLFNKAGLPTSPFRTDDWPEAAPAN